MHNGDSQNTAGKPFKSRSERTSLIVVDYAAAAQSAATQRSYEIDIRQFQLWGGAIPTTAAVLVKYLTEHAEKLAVATLQHRLIAIHRSHTDQGLQSPVLDKLVKRTMQGIRRTFGVAQRRVKAIVKDDLIEQLVLNSTQKPLKAARDQALLLLGFAGALRRSELVAIRCDDLTEFETGIEILLRRSKTDQEGNGRTVWIPRAKVASRCPVQALKLWRELAAIESGPVFRPINRHDQVVGTRALTPQSVALVVKSSVERIKGKEAASNVSGHSLRAGYCTEAAVAGLLPWQIREQTGHTSDVTLARYIRPVTRRAIPSLL